MGRDGLSLPLASILLHHPQGPRWPGWEDSVANGEVGWGDPRPTAQRPEPRPPPRRASLPHRGTEALWAAPNHGLWMEAALEPGGVAWVLQR